VLNVGYNSNRAQETIPEGYTLPSAFLAAGKFIIYSPVCIRSFYMIQSFLLHFHHAFSNLLNIEQKIAILTINHTIERSYYLKAVICQFLSHDLIIKHINWFLLKRMIGSYKKT
jgi:hypothetical protein